MSRRQLVDLSQEAISYQSGSLFFREMTLLFEGIKEQRDFTASALEEAGLASLIKRYTGLSVKVFVDRSNFDYNAAIKVPDIDSNAIFNDYFKSIGLAGVLYGEQISEAKLRSVSEDLRGTVDLKRGRVSGLFSKLTMPLILGRSLMTELHADEIAAAVLHELGHAFNWFWILTQTVSTNLAITVASAALNNARSYKERLELVHVYGRSTGVKISNPSEIAANETDISGYQSVLLRETVDSRARSATDSKLYDMTGDEYLADQFAVMWGSARAFASGDAKMNKYFGDAYKQHYLAYFFTEASKVAYQGLLIGLGLSGLVVPAAGGAIVLLLIPVFTLTALFTPGRTMSRYDGPFERMLRVKQSLIQALKDRQLPPADQTKIREDIEFIDSLIAGGKDRRTLFDIIWTSLTPARRKQHNQIRFQKELESAINNNLFVSVSKLNQLAQPQGA